MTIKPLRGKNGMARVAEVSDTRGQPAVDSSADALRRVWPGESYPLGATWDGKGTNFSVFSEVATRIELCLFDDAGRERRVDLPETTAHCWHGYLPGVGPGQRYGFRVHGPWAPEQGARCNPQKLLLDPYARAIDGAFRWEEPLFDHHFDAPDRPNDVDSAPCAPRSVICATTFVWAGDARPAIPLHKTVIYETHVRGLTMRHPAVPPELRGTYAGLAHPAIVRYLVELGVTAVELMPVHQYVPRTPHGRPNYWGYDSIGYFAPHNGYASAGQAGEQVDEFKSMVKALHAEGIEVILDVVYNHTAEGNHLGPTLCLKGFDNAAFYRLMPDARYYMDYTGCGNSLNMRHPHTLQLIMDSLRYWVSEMHVDGFRFDLAAALARELHDVDRLSAFFDLIQQDPVVRRVKLIAEPWDIGQGGYQVGNFPPLWSEWNGKYRDTVRDYWRGVDQTLGEFASRFTGSSDLYGHSGRRPYASINFVTAHDGFTLTDLVSYNEKQNEANGEHNRDGESENRSWNCGVEGPTSDPAVLALRARQRRNFLATLFLSQGVPMLLGGDEVGRTQRGNNNGYCQDNEICWYDWESVDEDLLAFTQRLIAFRRAHPVFSRRRWFQGTPVRGSKVSDIAWFTPDGAPMSDQHWSEGFAKTLMVFLNGDAIPSRGPHAEVVTDDSFLVLFNAHWDPLTFTVPGPKLGRSWTIVIDTCSSDPPDEGIVAAGGTLDVCGRCLVVLQRRSH